MNDEASISRILGKEIIDINPYPHTDLDDIWIQGRIRKHFEEQLSEDTELINKEDENIRPITEQ